ncbi:MAG: GntR family transcriptional regulator, partial [Acidobacteriota bacterium]|nr:GntR family transcriptional regulator [Acidobacteriota bacterium]
MSEKRLFHSVATQIGALIDEGIFPPGTRLPGERELAERFGVSRVTIREAEIALQAVGRIEIKTGSGVFVCTEQQVQQGILPKVSAFEVTEARLAIESEGAALAAKVIS